VRGAGGSVRRVAATVVAIAVLAVAAYFANRPEAPGASGYAPAGPAPAQAIPGGTLAAHEAAGGHTLARHVGRSASDLEERAAREGKREVSTFPDAASAERAVAEVLWRRREEVSRWLAGSPRGSRDFEARLEREAGTVWRAGSARASPGRTVRVVLVPSTKFAEGFSVLTAYVTLP
jgi:filamentous hemagglutinin